MTNFEKLDAAITYGVQHPEEFDMSEWLRISACGTTACLAGTAALLEGWKPTLEAGEWGTWAIVEDREGNARDVDDVAMEILGLTPGQYPVFLAGDIDEVIKMRNAWAEKEGVPERQWDVPQSMLMWHKRED